MVPVEISDGRCILPAMTWWQRLKEIIERQGITVAALSARTGIPEKTIYGYLRGISENPRGNVVKKLANGVGVSELELRFGDDAKQQLGQVNLPRIPLLDMNKLGTLNRGQPPLEVWDEVSLMYQGRVNLSQEAFGLEIKDESAMPDIKPGEVIVFDPRAEIIPGKLTLAVLANQKIGVIGRYRPLSVAGSDQFTIVTLNPDYPDVTVNEANPGFVVARAVQHIRKLD